MKGPGGGAASSGGARTRTNVYAYVPRRSDARAPAVPDWQRRGCRGAGRPGQSRKTAPACLFLVLVDHCRSSCVSSGVLSGLPDPGLRSLSIRYNLKTRGASHERWPAGGLDSITCKEVRPGKRRQRI